MTVGRRVWSLFRTSETRPTGWRRTDAHRQDRRRSSLCSRLHARPPPTTSPPAMIDPVRNLFASILHYRPSITRLLPSARKQIAESVSIIVCRVRAGFDKTLPGTVSCRLCRLFVYGADITSVRTATSVSSFLAISFLSASTLSAPFT